MAAQIKLLLSVLEEDPGINSALTEICQVLRVGFEDKIAQVKKRVQRYLLCSGWALIRTASLYIVQPLSNLRALSEIATSSELVDQSLSSIYAAKRRTFFQVFLTTLELLDATLVSIGACKEARRNHVVAALEPTVATLLKKQGDGQARLRDGAMNGLVAVARCRMAGPVFVRCVFLPHVSLVTCCARAHENDDD